MMIPATKKLAYMGACVGMAFLLLGNPSLDSVAVDVMGAGVFVTSGSGVFGVDHERPVFFESCGISSWG